MELRAQAPSPIRASTRFAQRGEFDVPAAQEYRRLVHGFALFVGLYLLFAVVLGFAFSWGWAAVVVFMGLIPGVALKFAAGRTEDSHLDWDQAERDRQKRH